MSGSPDLKRTLGFDTARCTGRYGLEPDGGWCPERDTCRRYLAYAYWDKEAGLEDYQPIPVTTARMGCTDKIEVETA